VSGDLSWHCKQIPNGDNPIVVCERETLQAEIERLTAWAVLQDAADDEHLAEIERLRAEVERLRAVRPTLLPSAHELLTDEIDEDSPDKRTLTQAGNEINRLSAWKAEATEVIERWETLVPLCDSTVLDWLGRPKADQVAAHIATQAAEVEFLRCALAQAAGVLSTLPPFEHTHPEVVMAWLIERVPRG
jgi:hypothetical protein